MDGIFAILGAVILVLLWIMIYDTTHFRSTYYLVEDPRIKKNFRAVVLADLHNQRYGRDNAVLLEAIHREKPDLVLVAGDLLTARPGADFEPALQLIGELAKDYAICYGVGNHEHRLGLYPENYGDMAEKYGESLKKHGVALMVNERRTFEEWGVCVVGSQIDRRFYQRFHKMPMEAEYLKETVGEPDQGAYTVFLGHNPDYFPEYAAWGADLVLSGHVHGGVVRVPVWNQGLISPSLRLFPKYDGGSFREGDSVMILSRGLGSHTIPVRFFNPGDLIFLDFQNGGEKKVELQKKT